ncbi:flagellar basal body rod protein FlgB [Castellaniella sp.]|uniref:flagellar basal body rod protein FlgB n=1 Tax=Castellaniella sp. TaxID=1955812 RepID=UPI003567F464
MMERIAVDLDFYRTALAVREQRQAVLASNIAHADTPLYKARDVDFAATLARMTDHGGIPAPGRVTLHLTSSRHIGAQAPRAPGVDDPLFRIPHQPSLDGNTVEMDVERVEFADNTLRYQTELQVLNQRIRSLLSAIQS